MRIIDPQSTPVPDLHQFLVGTVAPRPIAFVSTVDEKGVPNLAPYSFFNVFSANPPILVFSSNRRVRDNSTKDTLHNVETTREVVINMVSYAIVRQMAVASIEYPPGANEFLKSGLTPIPSDLVKPFRVAESPAQLECKVNQILPLGEGGGAGHLIICEMLRMHLDDAVLDDNGRINPHKIDLMGRMGRAYYARASGEAIHTIFQPPERLAIGYDQLPQSVRESTILTGNDLGQLASIEAVPSEEELRAVRSRPLVAAALQTHDPLPNLHQLARTELEKDDQKTAAAILWLADSLLRE